MKIRTGFVSNSSSSSFVVAFPRKPESVDDVKKMLFDKDQTHYKHPYGTWEDGKEKDVVYPVDRVAETVWEDIKHQDPNNMEAIYESISCGWFDEFDGLSGHIDEYGNIWDAKYSTNHLDYSNPDDKKKIDEIWKAREEESDRRAKEIADRFMAKCEDMFVYVFEYSDNDSIYHAALEHGDLFKKLFNIRTSYH